jgi:hypothetical protein
LDDERRSSANREEAEVEPTLKSLGIPGCHVDCAVPRINEGGREISAGILAIVLEGSSAETIE